MHKKLKISLVIIFILIGVIGGIMANSKFNKASLKFPKIANTDSKISKTENTQSFHFQTEIDSLLVNNQIPVGLKTLLQNTKNELNKSLEQPKFQRDMIGHSDTRTAEAFVNISFVKNMLKLNETIARLDKHIDAAKNEAIKIKSTESVKRLEALRASLKLLSSLLARQNFPAIEAALQSIKKNQLAQLIKSANVTHKSLATDSSLVQSVREIQKIIQLDMPGKSYVTQAQSLKLKPQKKTAQSPRKNPPPIERFTDPNRILKIGYCLSRWDEDEMTPSAEDLAEMETYTRNFILENTYGKMDVQFQYGGQGVVFAPMYASADRTPDSQQYYDEAELAMCGGDFDLDSLDIFVHSFPSEIVASGGFFHDIFIFSSDLPEGYKIIPGIAVNNSLPGFLYGRALSQLITHEMGHVFGANHAEGYECYDHSYKATGCDVTMYGNAHDKMGDSRGHYGAYFKYLFGWITALTITADGVYDIEAISNPSSTPHLFMIPFRDHKICVAYRKPLGEDDFLTRYPREDPPPPNYTTASAFNPDGELEISICNDSDFSWDIKTYLIDTTPNSNPIINDERSINTDFLDARLKPMILWSNSDLGIESIGFRKSPDGRHRARVEIELDESKL